MQFINPLYLIVNTNSVDEIGDITITPTERKVLAHITSIKQSEFYQAQANGLKPEITFIIRSFEYKNEKFARQGNRIYKVLRSYDRSDGNVELVCIGVVNNVDS
ncbi:phage head closure protein [Clostridium sp.]|uniref:phage head closure protein n=1 Tax=Clostridium sp. TaxID=1506 RepID=UPI00260CAE70|nr:phage head closure protein [Clostridium sp.]